MCAGQNLTDVSKLGYVDLDIEQEGGVLLQSRMTTLAPSSSGRRVSLGSHALNGLLQWEHSAKNRQKVSPFGVPLPVLHAAQCNTSRRILLHEASPSQL